MRVLFWRFVNDQSAATLTECSLIAAGITVAVISVLWAHYHFPSVQTTLK